MRQSNGTGLALLFGLLALGVIVVGLSATVLMQIDSGGEQPDRSWNRVRSTGVLVIGTAADNPPFTYYDDSLRLTGYDIALASSLASRLGLRPQFVDYTFEGLPAALQTGQIDAAIAAISVSPDRATLVDFTRVYYVGSDEMLALAATQSGPIRAADDLSGKRVGVQRGTVYESWLAARLPRQSVLAYPRVDDAVRDLRIQRLDYVMLDLAPAEALARDGSLTAVGRGLDEQRYGIAVRRGTTTLLDRLDRALEQARAEGELDQLARQYLRVSAEQTLPQPTPGPAAPRSGQASALPLACANAMAVGQSLGLADTPDGPPTVVQPGQTFTKGWALRNTGTCAWNAKYRLVFVQGNTPAARMGVEMAPVGKTVSAGDSLSLTLELAAPLIPGVYQAIWQMEDDKGVPFGQRVQLRLSVPLPTVSAAPTPAPAIASSQQTQLGADRLRVRSGERAVVTWRADGARSAYLYAVGERWQDSAVSTTGQREYYPQSVTTYELRVVRDTGVELRQVRVDVDATSGAPIISQFTASATSVSPPQCVDITWDIRGDVSRVNVVSGAVTLWDGAPTADTLRDCPTMAGTVEYRLEVTGPGGSSRAQRFVGVTQAPPPAGTPAATGAAVPTFVASPSRVQTGSCVGLTWNAAGASLVRLQRNGVVVLDRAAPTGQAQDCPRPAGTFVYRIDVVDQTDQSVSREQSVVVADGPPSAAPIAGNWRVARLLDGQTLGTPAAASALTLQFVDADRIEGLAGCNSYSARYTSDAASLRLTDLGSTSANCASPPGVMQQESRFLEALRMTVRYTLTSDTLNLQDSGGRVLAELHRSQTPGQ